MMMADLPEDEIKLSLSISDENEVTPETEDCVLENYSLIYETFDPPQ
jgi:hypothetical protein